MKTLVTGGTGFIGSHVIEKLCERGDQVVTVSKDRLNLIELKKLGVEVIDGDINSINSWENILEDVDIVFHIAGVTHAKNSCDYYEGNHTATKRIIELCSELCNNLKRFVYVSSLAAVGPSMQNIPVDESSPYHPVSDYGRSKMLGELEVLKFSDKLPITIVRPSAVYGPRERDMYMYMKSIKRGILMLIGFNQKYLNLIYVDDLIEGIILASVSDRAINQIYFLGSEVAYPNEEIGRTIAEVIHRNPLGFHVPHCIVYFICAVEELIGKIFGNQVFLNLQKARELTQTAWHCSIEKARRELGFNPKTSLHDGFTNTFKWYKQMGWL